MAIYRCSRCDEMKDGDYDVCTEDPDEEFGLMCESCTCELPEPTLEVRQGGVFSKAQLATIARLEAEDERFIQ